MVMDVKFISHRGNLNGPNKKQKTQLNKLILLSTKGLNVRLMFGLLMIIYF